MKALVIYDSVFGNTEKIAQAIGAALGETGASVQVVRVTDIKPDSLPGVELLLVGSPTRGFRATKPTSEFLKSIPGDSLKEVKVTAFDTRMALEDVNSGILNFMVKIFGYAAEPIAQKLVRKGGALLLPAEGFIVKASEGPLKDGELERAAGWAKQAAAKA